VAAAALALAGLLLPFALKLAGTYRRRIHVDPGAHAWRVTPANERFDSPHGTRLAPLHLPEEEMEAFDQDDTLRKILRSLERHAA
jgi:hypothetical protein